MLLAIKYKYNNKCKEKMAIFQNLSEKLNHVFSKMKNKTGLTQLELKEAMREVRIALLEADVNFAVTKQFINNVTEKAIGQDVLKGLNSTQQVIKIVNDELIELMGSKHSKLQVSDKPPTVYGLWFTRCWQNYDVW